MGRPRALGRRERELFDALTLPEHRQLEWLGRAHRGQGVRRRAAARACSASSCCPAEIEILPDELRRPDRARAGTRDGSRSTPVVSLTHAHGHAAALAALGAARRRQRHRHRPRAARPAAAGLCAGGADRHRTQPARRPADRTPPRSGCCDSGAHERRPARRSDRASAAAPAHRACRQSTPSTRRVLVDVAGRRNSSPGRGARTTRDRRDRRATPARRATTSSRRLGNDDIDPQVMEGILELLREAQGDWEYEGEIGPDTLFVADLGLESLEIVVLSTMVQQQLRAPALPPVLRRDRPAPGRAARPVRHGPRHVRVRAPSTDPPGGVTWDRRC